MPKTTSSNLSEAQQYFRKQVLESYDLEEEFIKKLCDIFSDACDKHLSCSTTTAKGATAAKSSAKPKTKRKKSAYNLYVREMMKTEEIQTLDHKEKMSAIAKQWKALDDAAKVEYTEMASNENAAATEATEEE
jgi:hypothetical protein